MERRLSDCSQHIHTHTVCMLNKYTCTTVGMASIHFTWGVWLHLAVFLSIFFYIYLVVAFSFWTTPFLTFFHSHTHTFYWFYCGYSLERQRVDGFLSMLLISISFSQSLTTAHIRFFIFWFSISLLRLSAIRFYFIGFAQCHYYCCCCWLLVLFNQAICSRNSILNNVKNRQVIAKIRFFSP